MNNELIFWHIAAFAAFFVKGLCGFANTLIFSSILSFTSNNINISPVEVVLGFPTNLIIACKERKSIKADICIPLSVLVLAGSIPGVFLLKNTDTTFIKIIFGIVVTLIGIEMLVREYQKKKYNASRIGMTVIGLLSGLLCGLYGVGALLGAYVSRVSDNTKEFKANLCVVFITENLFRIFLYTMTGIITASALRTVLYLIPAMLAGLYLGMRCSSILNEAYARKIVILMLTVSGLALVITNIL